MGLLPRRRESAREGDTRDAGSPTSRAKPRFLLFRRREAPSVTTTRTKEHPTFYRVEVDTEPHHFPSHSPFSFWSAVQYIFVLSLLLWWLPYNIGGMVAGYVGGRRAGSHWKAVVAALVPVMFFAGVQWLAVNGFGVGALSYLESLPRSVAAAFAGAFPPATPYIEFVATYFATFGAALESTFSMQANGYLIVIVFAYVGGIVGEQARREMGEEVASPSMRIVQPMIEHLRHPVASARAATSGAGRKPPRAAAAVTGARRKARPRTSRRGVAQRFSEFRRIEAEAVHRQLPRPRPAPPRALAAEPRSPPRAEPPRDRARDLATQRFVERALRAYDRPHRRAG